MKLIFFLIVIILVEVNADEWVVKCVDGYDCCTTAKIEDGCLTKVINTCLGYNSTINGTEGYCKCCTENAERDIERATHWYMVGGIVSLLACLAMEVSYHRADKLQRLPPADLLRNRTLCDMGAALAHIIPSFVKNHHLNSMCKVQAILIQFFYSASMVWWICFSMELLSAVHNPFTDARVNRRFYHSIMWIFSILGCVILLSAEHIGLTTFDFCWAVDDITVLFLFHIPVLVGTMFSVCVLVYVQLNARLSIPASHKMRTIIIKQGRWYVLLIGIYWAFTGVVWFGELKVVAMTFVVASRGLVSLAVWVITLRLVKMRDGNQTEVELGDNTLLDVPEQCQDSIPLKWALRRDVMIACQQGIEAMTSMTVETLASLPSSYKIRPVDFKQQVVRQIERRDSDIYFTFYDYAPLCFHSIRGSMGLNADVYRSIFSYENFDDVMMEKFTDGGRSGSFFYFTAGKEFIVKTITAMERQLLMSFLTDYYDHLMNYPNSLIVRFYGLHSIKMHRGAQKTHFVVMDNLFLTKRHIDEVYDIKGSWVDRGPAVKDSGDDSPVHSRTAAFLVLLKNNAAGSSGTGGESQQSHVLKDLDISGVKKIHIHPDVRSQLLEQVERDVDFFTRHNIMDYSLLIGIHKAPFEELRMPRKDLTLDITAPPESPQSPVYRRLSRMQAYQPPKLRPPKNNVGKSNSLLSVPDEELKVFNDVTSTIPSAPKPKALPIYRRDEGGLYSNISKKELYSGDAMYFLGVIDILQPWNTQKKLERACKLTFLRKDPEGLSAAEPSHYGSRFYKRCCELFAAEGEAIVPTGPLQELNQSISHNIQYEDIACD